jgi:dihydropteroate synthase
MDKASLPQRLPAKWQLRTRSLSLGQRTLIMGVVNITLDSFSDGGLYLNPSQAIDHGLQLIEEGADILDLGAESTRPGSHAGDPDAAAVSSGEEQSRLLPVIEGILKASPSALISADTYKAATARAALHAGAEIINDVSGFQWDREMVSVCSQLPCGLVLMHTRGRPDEWKTQASLVDDEVLPIVHEGLDNILQAARDAGISLERAVLDPGYGFGKRLDENYALLARQSELLTLGRPLLAGVSRKSFLTRTLAHTSALQRKIPDTASQAESRETASTAAIVATILTGASIVRVHSVRAAVEAAAIADAVLTAR